MQQTDAIFACLARFARRTKKKERLLVVYIINFSKILRSESEIGRPVVTRKQRSHHRGIEKLQVLY